MLQFDGWLGCGSSFVWCVLALQSMGMWTFDLGWRWWLVDTRARVNDDEHEDAGLRKRYKGDLRYCLDNMETKWKVK